MYDLAIIGGGVIGVATALRIAETCPGLAIAVLEKEDGLARHQSGRNSGVIHAGVYYKPGTMKAQFCREGVEATIAFCKEHGIAFEQCGKMIVATEPEDMPRMIALHERSAENGLAVERLDAAELKRREPHVRGLGALFVPTTGIVDYAEITRKMGELFTARGGEILMGRAVTGIREEQDGVVIETPKGEVRARHVIACAGIMADRVAAMSGLKLDFQLIPFRGEYYRLPPDKDRIVNHLIYPVPDPSLPILGVHLTKMIGGYVTVGPSAVLAFSREGYRLTDVNLRDLREIFGYVGFRKLARAHMAMGISEFGNALMRSRYLKVCQRYCPELRVEDLLPYRPGLRAQPVLADGTIVNDFIIRSTTRIVHVCNAPSPAATSSMPIAKEVARVAAAQFGWKAPAEPARQVYA